jgi:hypothetical protein
LICRVLLIPFANELRDYRGDRFSWSLKITANVDGFMKLGHLKNVRPATELILKTDFLFTQNTNWNRRHLMLPGDAKCPLIFRRAPIL